jgi:uncharacterized LabA/DUF88 family protein
MPFLAHAFVDGKYLRKVCENLSLPFRNPQALVHYITNSQDIQSWSTPHFGARDIILARTTYYDGRPDDDSEIPDDLRKYWTEIELLPDTQLGFGSTRGGTKTKAPRQKGVDTLIAVDVLVGAFTNLFSVAILVAGDADFVPVVNEVKRRGVMVVVAASEADKSVSEDLKRSADRFVDISNPLNGVAQLV